VKKEIVSNQEQYRVKCLPALHTVPSLSYVLQMADTPGRFDAIKAQRLGVPSGPLRKCLCQGHPIETPDGKRVLPEDVLGPMRKGLSIVFSGDTRPNPNLVKAAKNARLLIHDATFTSSHNDNATQYLHSTAAQAAEIANQAQVTQLALVHISPRYVSTEEHEKEAMAIFPQSFVPKDLDSIELKSID